VRWLRHRPIATVLKLPSPTEFVHRTRYRRYWVPRPRFNLGACRHLILPVFPSYGAPEDATPRTILSWCSALLHGFAQPTRSTPFDGEHLSWGSLPLQRIRGGESTSAQSLLCASPLGVTQASPSSSQPLGTVPLAGFLGLSAAYSSPHRPAMFQAGSVRGVNPSGD